MCIIPLNNDGEDGLRATAGGDRRPSQCLFYEIPLRSFVAAHACGVGGVDAVGGVDVDADAAHADDTAYASAYADATYAAARARNARSLPPSHGPNWNARPRSLRSGSHPGSLCIYVIHTYLWVERLVNSSLYSKDFEIIHFGSWIW